MFNHLDHREEREIRMQKSKIYKEMLDNQIFLNQQYRRKQEAKRIAQQKSSQRPKINDKRQSYDRPYQKQKQYKKQKKVIHLPTLQDKQTLYQGHSNYLSTPYPKSRRRVISRIQTEQVAKYDDSVSSSQSERMEDIQQILIELKLLNKQVKKVKNNIKKKHLNNLISSSRKPRKERYHQIDLNYPENAQQISSAKVSKKYKSPSSSKRYDDFDQNKKTIQHGDQNRNQRGKRMESFLYQQPKSNKKVDQRSPALQDKVNASSDQYINENSQIQRQRRERFLQILRKVKNRGESLYIKLSKFPKN